jgi:hypothetical protein
MTPLDRGPRERVDPRPQRPVDRRPLDPPTERIRLIEFLWVGSAGIQPVLMVDREYLH